MMDRSCPPVHPDGPGLRRSYQTPTPEGVRRWCAAVSAVVPVVVIVGARLRLSGNGRLWPSGTDLVEPVDHVDARADRGVEDRAFAVGVDGGPDGGEDAVTGPLLLRCVSTPDSTRTLPALRAAYVSGSRGPRRWSCGWRACRCGGRSRGGCSGGPGMRQRPRARDPCRRRDGNCGSSREVVGEHAGGVAPGTLDGRGPLFGYHAGGGCESGGVLVGGGQDVEDVADEQLVDASELAAQDMVAGENLLELAVDGGDGVAVGGSGRKVEMSRKPFSKAIFTRPPAMASGLPPSWLMMLRSCPAAGR